MRCPDSRPGPCPARTWSQYAAMSPARLSSAPSATPVSVTYSGTPSSAQCAMACPRPCGTTGQPMSVSTSPGRPVKARRHDSTTRV